MASKPATSTAFNAVMDFVANQAAPVEQPAAPAAPAPEPVATPAATSAPAASVEQPADQQQPMGRKEPAPSTPGETLDYAALFLQPVRTRKTKAIYVDEDLHTALSTLTQAAGVGLADLLINIANHHFDTFRPAIRQFLNDQEKLKKKKLPY